MVPSTKPLWRKNLVLRVQCSNSGSLSLYLSCWVLNLTISSSVRAEQKLDTFSFHDCYHPFPAPFLPVFITGVKKHRWWLSQYFVPKEVRVWLISRASCDSVPFYRPPILAAIMSLVAPWIWRVYQMVTSLRVVNKPNCPSALRGISFSLQSHLTSVFHCFCSNGRF